MNRIKKNYAVSVLFVCLSFVFAGCPDDKKNEQLQEQADLTNVKFTVEEAPEWSNLFKRTSGWFGGDGIFAFAMNAKDNTPASDSSNNMIVFSDTMLGDIVNGKLQSGSKMVHNTVAMLHGDKPDSAGIKFYWATKADGKPETIFIPRTPSATAGDYYWLGDGFVNPETNNTYVFAYRMHNMDTSDDWSFRLMNTDIMAMPTGSEPPFKDQRQIETPFNFHKFDSTDDGSFGAGIFVNTERADALHPDGFVYVYGVKGREKKLIVARVTPKDFEDFTQWRFWDGKEWSNDFQKVAAITDGVSNELSVSTLKDGRYLLVFQVNGMSNTVAMRLGASPVGPFGPVINIFECQETKENKRYITYNAKAHPSLSKPGELLVSYNVNANDFKNELPKNPQLYRPRFVRIKFE